MPKFDDTIRQAILRATEIAGSQAALCKKTGLSSSIMSRYLNGDVRYINPGTWKLLFPHIAPYLSEDFQPKAELPFSSGDTVQAPNLDEDICRAIDAAARNHPRGAFGLAAETGFTPAQICRYRHGRVGWINPKTWNRLYPHIAPYLPDGFQPEQTVSSGCCEVIVKIVRRLSEKEAVQALSMMAAYFPEAAAAALDFPLINRPQNNHKEIDEAILNAMKAAVKKSGSQLRFAQVTGIKQQNISRYLNRQVTFINAKTWQLLAPHLPGFNNNNHKENDNA